MVAICLVFFFFLFQYYYTDFSSDGIAQKKKKEDLSLILCLAASQPILYLCYFILVPLPFSFMTCRLSLLLGSFFLACRCKSFFAWFLLSRHYILIFSMYILLLMIYFYSFLRFCLNIIYEPLVYSGSYKVYFNEYS